MLKYNKEVGKYVVKYNENLHRLLIHNQLLKQTQTKNYTIIVINITKKL